MWKIGAAILWQEFPLIAGRQCHWWDNAWMASPGSEEAHPWLIVLYCVLLFSYTFTALAVCLGSLSCWTWNHYQSDAFQLALQVHEHDDSVKNNEIQFTFFFFLNWIMIESSFACYQCRNKTLFPCSTMKEWNDLTLLNIFHLKVEAWYEDAHSLRAFTIQQFNDLKHTQTWLPWPPYQ